VTPQPYILTLPSTTGWKGCFFFVIELKSTSRGGVAFSAMVALEGRRLDALKSLTFFLGV
jgi:hypothetical protein